MTTIKLYSGNGVSFSPENAEGRTESQYIRLVADENKALTNGVDYVSCVDVHSSRVSDWSEVDSPDDIPPEEAFDIIFGGAE